MKDPKISPPAPFDGKAYELDSFLFAITEYFYMKPNDLPDEPSRLAFLTTVFSGSVLGWWRGVRAQFSTSEQALLALKDAYGDPFQKDRNFHKLQTLKQTGSITAFFNEVERLNLHVGLDRQTLRTMLGPALKEEVRTALAGVPYDLSSFEEWKRTATRIGIQQEFSQTRTTRPTAPRPAAPTTEPTKATYPTRPPRPTFNKPQPSQSSAAQPSRPKVPEAVVERRKKEGVCLKCGKQNHRASECRTGWVLTLAAKPARKRKASEDTEEPAAKRQDSGNGQRA